MDDDGAVMLKEHPEEKLCNFSNIGAPKQK